MNPSFRRVVLWALCCCGIAQAAELPKGVTAGPSYGGISEYRLDNGLKVLLYPDPSKPRMLVNVTYLVGSRHENYGETGMAHLLEHLVFKGTPEFQNIDVEFNKRGMRSNGTTSADRTNYFEVFEANEDSLNWALAMEASRMTRSFIAKKDLDSEMTVVRNEMERGETDPFRVSYKNLLSLAYQWHNYGNDTIGARADVENVPIDRLQAFYRTWYQPDNAVLLVAGAINPETTLVTIAREFGAIPKPERQLPAQYTREPAQDGAREGTVRRIAGTPLLLAGYHTPGAGHPEIAAVKLLGIVLGDEQTGRLRSELVDPGLAAAAGVFVGDNRDSGMLIAYAQLGKDQDLGKARAGLIETLEGASKAPISSAEFERAQLKYRNEMKAALDDVSRLGIALSEYIAAGDWRLFFWEQQQVEQLQLEAVNAVAQRYLRSVNRSLVNYEPAQDVERVEIPQPPAPDTLLANLKKDQATEQGESFELTPAEIEQRTLRKELRPGLSVALLPKKTRNGVVNFQLRLNYGDEQSLRDRNEAAGAFAGLLLRGTQQLDRVGFDDALEKLEAQVNAGGGSNGLLITGRTTAKHLPQLLELLVSALKQPRLDPKEFETLRKETIAGLEFGENDPQARAFEKHGEISNAYPEGHPRAFYSTEQRKARVQALQLEQVIAFHKDFINAAQAHIGMVGDFDPDTVNGQITDLLGDWNSGTLPYTRIADRLSERTGAAERVDTPDQANGMLIASLPLAINDADVDFPALLLANHVLGGAGLDSRLMERLRTKEGWSYGAGSSLNAGPIEPAGSWMAFAIAAPENLLKALGGLREELQRLHDEGVSAAELANAKAGWLKARRVTWADDARLVAMLVGQSDLGRTMQESAELEAKVEALTLEQVNAVIRKRLAPQAWNSVVAGDSKKLVSP
jgi:zinc protease